jgi:hypothetical protein
MTIGCFLWVAMNDDTDALPALESRRLGRERFEVPGTSLQK